MAAPKSNAEVAPQSWKTPGSVSLDLPALLVPGGDYVALTLYPTAGEATAIVVPKRSDKPHDTLPDRAKRPPELVELDSALRARGEIRRQIRANRGRYLWTFTFAEATYDLAAVAAAVAHFLVRLRQTFGPVWFVLVPEPHPGGHGWHVHGATNRFLEIADVTAAWSKGWCWVGDHAHKNQTWATRNLAGYLAKYATKLIAGGELYGCEPRKKGAHRYYVTQGFDPQCVRKAFRSITQALKWVLKHYGTWDKDGDLPGERDIPVVGVWLRFADACLRPWTSRPET